MTDKRLNGYDYLMNYMGVSKQTVRLAVEAEKASAAAFSQADEICSYNQAKVLDAMRKNRLSEAHFQRATGYGYNDIGRDVTEAIYADIFRAEDALVRPQIISGTHALTVALFGNLRHGDELLSAVGQPYDTLMSVISARGKGSLSDHGITFKQVELLPGGRIDYQGVADAITAKTKLVTIQRSKGYAWRPSLTVAEIGRLIEHIKKIRSDIICMVDNCYGEFVEVIEPTEVGADMAVGSLIKNPGGGLAPVGGYVAGKREYVEQAAYRLSAPGIGKEAGPSLGLVSDMLHGLFLAPQTVCGAVKGAIFASRLLSDLGFEVSPTPDDTRSDIVQAVRFGNPESVVAFLGGIQAASPVDAFVKPVPNPMPGYDCDVIMAAGAFVQGSSIELSADAPMREPYIAYMQGGLTFDHARLGITLAADRLVSQGISHT